LLETSFAEFTALSTLFKGTKYQMKKTLVFLFLVLFCVCAQWASQIKGISILNLAIESNQPIISLELYNLKKKKMDLMKGVECINALPTSHGPPHLALEVYLLHLKFFSKAQYLKWIGYNGY
jgi:hypothetical protein